MFASFCSVRTLTMVNLKLSMQCCWVSCWEELAVLSSLQHTTGYRMFLVAGSKKLKLISLNKRLPRKHKVEWLLIWLIQQLCVIFTDHIFFFLLCYLQYVRAVLTLASMMITRYSLPPFLPSIFCKVTLIVLCVQTWQLPEKEKGCVFPFVAF